MSTDIISPDSDGSYLPYTRAIGPPLILLLKHVPEIPVCELLWKNMGQHNKGSLFTLELIDPLSEQTRVFSTRCISGKSLDIYWDTSVEFSGITYSSGHPCNMERPPCLGKTTRVQVIPPPTTPIVIHRSLWQQMVQRIRPEKKRAALPPDSEPEAPDDVEIPELPLLRSSLQLAPDLRAYRVIIETHHQPDVSGKETIFCSTLSFGRCGRGQNMLSLRCQEGDGDGLIVTIR